MTFRGYSVLAVLALAAILAAVALAVRGAVASQWAPLATGGVLALAGIGLAVLSVLDEPEA